MQIRIVIIFVLALYGAMPAALGQTTNWTAFHNGVFHVYSSTDGQHYVVHQDGQTQLAVIEGSEDSIICQIQWLNDSDYIAQFVSTTIPLDKRQERFFGHHKLYYHLHSAGKGFCVYTETADRLKGKRLEQDTMWLQPVPATTGASLTKEIRGESRLRDMHFSDTSSYAVLYIYRPLLMMFSAYSYNMYAEDHLLCSVKNGSQHIYAVYQKGPLKLRSQLGTDTCTVSLTIEPGKSYYIMSTIHFGIFGTRNYKLLLVPRSVLDGSYEFHHAYNHGI